MPKQSCLLLCLERLSQKASPTSRSVSTLGMLALTFSALQPCASAISNSMRARTEDGQNRAAHPGKVYDRVSDAVIDACLAADPKSKLLVRQATKDNMVMVAGEIKTQAKLDYERVIRG